MKELRLRRSDASLIFSEDGSAEIYAQMTEHRDAYYAAIAAYRPGESDAEEMAVLAAVYNAHYERFTALVERGVLLPLFGRLH